MRVYLLVISLFILSYIGTYLIKTLAKRSKLVSIPNERSLHTIPTPHGGGLAIIISWFIGITFLFFWGLIDKSLFFALLCGLLLAIISLLDDLGNIKPVFRLLAQFVSVLAAFYFLNMQHLNITHNISSIYEIFVYISAVIGMVWFINLFNFMDGADGFASAEAITVSLALFIFSGSLINLILIACVLGFLIWNWPKAKIFMGDVGSTQLGFILIVLGINFNNTDQFPILNWFLLTSVFWYDATFTLFRRWRNREKLSEAHKKHIYQRAVQGGISHLRLDLTLLLINISVFFMILIYKEIKFLQIPCILISLAAFFTITKFVDNKVPFK